MYIYKENVYVRERGRDGGEKQYKTINTLISPSHISNEHTEPFLYLISAINIYNHFSSSQELQMQTTTFPKHTSTE